MLEGGERAYQEQILLSGEEAEGVYEVVHVFVVGSDDVLRAAVTPAKVLLSGYVDVELLGSIMGVAGIEECQCEEPGVVATDPKVAVPKFDAFESRGRM